MSTRHAQTVIFPEKQNEQMLAAKYSRLEVKEHQHELGAADRAAPLPHRLPRRPLRVRLFQGGIPRKGLLQLRVVRPQEVLR